MVKTFTLTNGVRVVLEEVPTVRSVTMGIWVLAGSMNETKEMNGISHFIEHMLFKGTKTRTPQDIAEAFDSIGGEVNAFTAKEYTCYYAKVIDSHKEYALSVLADMFFNSTFLEEEIEREKQVVYEEISMYEDTPDDIIHDLLAEASYKNHSLSYPILGHENQLKYFTKKDILQYMSDHYRAENIVISLAGNVDESFIPIIEKYFNFRQESKSELKELKTPIFLAEEKELLKDTEQAHLCIGLNGLSIEDEDTYSLAILNNAFGGSMSSRLFQEIREKRGLAYAVYSFHTAFKQSGLLTIYAGTNKDNLPTVKSTINQIIEDLSIKGLTDKELSNSREQLKGGLLLGLESTDSRMERNGRNELITRRHRSMDDIIERLDSVDHTSIKRVIDKILMRDQSQATILPKNA